MAAPVVDASWERVDAFEPPPMEQEGAWELVEDTSELIVLDLAQAESASSQAPTAPGTDVVLTGLETPTPMIKVGDTVMLGVHDELLGSEMVLERTADALTPLGPLDGSRPSGASSTSTRRITFTPARRTTHQVPAPEVEEEDMPLAWQAPV
ncbi:uncharacterized protein MRET_3556 [Malassezia restricta]|uniref:TFIIIC subunit n=1 Tax=Malassezia restricta (strain ATCC 96810 / NBRC 103918 / CBS 7877) TaxID=425264 RepID=A0A3G2S842_MALR7|nr:uncharacterized protein MRET_3556 [Malassezia restricta]AXA51748.1 uncharacterized protein MRET_3556 [Malassezia restricta]AYO44264.1 TFIIIC subunit [Malassezia restricta CBS 7877]